MGGGDKHFQKMFETQKCLYYLMWMGKPIWNIVPKLTFFLMTPPLNENKQKLEMGRNPSHGKFFFFNPSLRETCHFGTPLIY